MISEPEMVLIPGGEFIMGSDPTKDELAFEDEHPQHSIYLPDYHMAKTPITNSQYAEFIRDTGHVPPMYWRDGKIPDEKQDHPVVNVSWHDAVAYCEWLSKTTGRTYRLPTEAEWEKAARGTDGRIYPWGNNAPTDELCNFDENVGDTTPVGTYPAGANGLFDMAGNVLEWTSSLYKFGYPYNPENEREDMKMHRLRTLRGGGWSYTVDFVRCAFRGGVDPDVDFGGWGFRVAVGSPGF